MSTYTITNGRLTASIRSLGAELCSIVDNATGREFMWQGDANVWGGQSPLLFPVIGRVVGGKNRIYGEDYPMPMHGFARKMEFEAESVMEDSVCLLLRDNEETHKVYPFNFELRILLYFRQDSVVMEHKVTNLSEKDMYFCLGAHPGFFCAEGDILRLEVPETLTLRGLDIPADLLSPAKKTFNAENGTIALSSELFKDDALMFENIRSRSVTLERADGSSVHVEYCDAPCLGVWSKPIYPLRYVCIEPWYGIDDATDASGEFTEKPHCRAVAPNATFAFPVRITPKA